MCVFILNTMFSCLSVADINMLQFSTQCSSIYRECACCSFSGYVMPLITCI